MIQNALNTMLTLMLAKFILNDVLHMLEGSEVQSGPQDYRAVRRQIPYEPHTEFFHIAKEADVESIMRRGLDPPVYMIKGRDVLDKLLSGGIRGVVLRILVPPDWSVFPDEAWEEFYRKGVEPIYVYTDKRVRPNMIVVEGSW